ncbi:hypothetical protein [Alicyclobacillus dauci]|uniref:Uncharacterized protein n=1 Tax=Alicyclobacillus dauci TaxID=1475485 RepID=A0ABY6Z035_9BACL|nr:hypothetical protein [Alicyclobacillus dauci]WAH36082.1 hypothetical protein NZD86_17780 [Alicyclobacillus dauci]
MHWFVSYVVFELMIVAVAVLATVLVRIRRRSRLNRSITPPPGFVRTDEVSIDPTTGIAQRVWYDPATGERLYIRDANRDIRDSPPTNTKGK